MDYDFPYVHYPFPPRKNWCSPSSKWIFWRPIRDMIAASTLLLGCTPAQALLRKLFPEWPMEQIEVLHLFVTCPAAVLASLTMASEEMQSILDLDVALFDQYKQKFWIFFAEEDHWVGENKKIILQTVGDDLHEVRVVHGQYGIPHAFCICT